MAISCDRCRNPKGNHVRIESTGGWTRVDQIDLCKDCLELVVAFAHSTVQPSAAAERKEEK